MENREREGEREKERERVCMSERDLAVAKKEGTLATISSLYVYMFA